MVRTIHWGTGAMGSLALRLAALSPRVDVVGVVSHRSAEQARAVVAREANGLPESVVGGDRLEEVVRECGGADVVLPEELAGYQSYLVKGLPPAPIASPRIASIAGVAAPDLTGGYYYFVAACPNGVRDGSHYFSTTLEQHNAFIAQANQECAGQ